MQAEVAKYAVVVAPERCAFCNGANTPGRMVRKIASVPAGSQSASHSRVAKLKRIVYILKSERRPLRYYVGLTSDLRARLAEHNAGRCRHSASGRPWCIDVVVAFTDQQRAVAFEQYLKSGSGSAFARRHLRSRPPYVVPPSQR